MPPKDRHRRQGAAKEPLLLWWMPVVSLISPAIFAAWEAASSEGEALSDAGLALAWPGLALYLGTVVVLWAGWKIDLE